MKGVEYLTDISKTELDSFRNYLNSTPISELQTDYTFSLVYAGNDEDLHEQRYNLLYDRIVRNGSMQDRIKITPNAFDLWWADCIGRRNKDPGGFLDDALNEHEGQQRKAARRNGFSAQTLDSVQSKNVDWLVPGMFPRGELSVIGADGGTGKGLYTAQLAAFVTTGKTSEFFPGGAESVGNVLVFSGEDKPEYVLRPRYLAAGADLQRVKVVTAARFWSDTGEQVHIKALSMQRIIETEQPALVIIDPLQSFLPDKVDMSSRNSMRDAMTPLLATAEKVQCSVIFVLHTNKRENAFGRNRLADSSDLWDGARSVFMLGKSKSDGLVYVSHEKSNYAEKSETMLFKIESVTVEGVKTAKAVYAGRSEKTDADFVGERKFRQAQTKDDASAAILNILAENRLGSVESAQLKASVLKEIGCSERTYKAAYSELVKAGEISKRQIRQQDGNNRWFTYAFGDGQSASEDCFSTAQ